MGECADLDFTYTRSNAAVNSGVTFAVEWTDTLATGSWSTAGVTQQILTDNGTTRTIRASVVAGTKRFLRLRVVSLKNTRHDTETHRHVLPHPARLRPQQRARHRHVALRTPRSPPRGDRVCAGRRASGFGLARVFHRGARRSTPLAARCSSCGRPGACPRRCAHYGDSSAGSSCRSVLDLDGNHAQPCTRSLLVAGRCFEARNAHRYGKVKSRIAKRTSRCLSWGR